MNILITGGLGYIGRHVVDNLCKRGEIVHVIDKVDQQGIASDFTDKYPNCNIFLADLFDMDIRAYCVAHEIETIVHLAGATELRANVDFKREVYDLSVKVWSESLTSPYTKRFVNMSSAAAATVDTNDDGKLLESYGNNKASFEYRFNKYLDNSVKTFNLRLHNPYGHARNLKFSKHKKSLWFNIIKAMRTGDTLAITSMNESESGTAVRDWINIFDVAEIIARFATHCTKHYYRRDYWEIGTGVPMSAYNFTRSLILIEDVSLDYKFIPFNKLDTQRQVAKPERTFEYLDFRSKVGPKLYSNSYLNCVYII